MIFEIREIELLRIIALCKDIPAKLDYIEPFTEEFADRMHYLVKKIKSNQSYRLTDFGYELLASKGYKYANDKYPVGISKSMEKRLDNARVMICMYLAGINVFDRKLPYYISSASIKLSKGLGDLMCSSTLLGVMFEKDITYGILWAREDIDYSLEIETIKKINIKFSRNLNIRLIMFVQKHEDFKKINFQHSINSLMTCDMFGAKQLRILTAPNYSDELYNMFCDKEAFNCTDVNLLKLLGLETETYIPSRDFHD